MEEHGGTYIPPGLVPNQPLRAALDNIDAKVDTPDAKHSFHALASAIFQQGEPRGTDQHVRDLLNVNIPPDSKLKNVPNTVVEIVPCTITGSPKPRTSPHYPSFELFQHQDILKESNENDTAWLLGRYFKRKYVTTSSESRQTADRDPLPEEQPDDTDQTSPRSKQYIPVWSAYNSLLAKEQVVDNVHALPLINAPAHEWPTLVTSLLNLHNINVINTEPENKMPVCVWLDMDLYKRVLKLPYLDPQLYNGKWIESPGQFHTVLCALRCLGQTVESSGLDQAWVQADIYSNVTVAQIINGKHYNRAIDCHQFTLQVLSDLLFDAFFEKHPHAYEALETSLQNLTHACSGKHTVDKAHQQLKSAMLAADFQKLMDEFDAANEKYPLYKWARMYMRQVTDLLQFIRGTRQRQWNLHLASLEQLCISFFAYNRLDYAQNIPEYLARMYQLQQSDPLVWREFQNWNFTVNTNCVPFTAVGVDQAQEHINKVHKGDGGISGITNNPQALLRYCLSTPHLTAISQEMEEMLGMSKVTRDTHHALSNSIVMRQENNVLQLKEVLSKSNPFTVSKCEDGTEMKLYNITTNVIMPQNVQDSILGTEERGRTAYCNFVKERIQGQNNLWDKMTKVKVLGWNAGCTTIKVASGSTEVNLKASNFMMARLLVITRSTREIDLKEVIGNYEFSTTNSMLMKADGSLHPCEDKSQLIHQLEALVADEPVTEEPSPEEVAILEQTCIVFDGMAVVNELIVAKESIKKCSDLANYFVNAIDRKSSDYSISCVVFDNYSIQASMKYNTRQRRTGGRSSRTPDYKIDDSTKINDFTTFLRSTKTKELLTLYLAQKVAENCKSQVTTVTHLGVSTNQSPADIVDLNSSQEEADTLLILYAAEIHKSGFHVHIYASDTDVLVLALSELPQLGSEATVIMGTSTNRRHVKLQPIYNVLGASKVSALRGLHAISGCDTTGRIYGKSKTSWWKAFTTAEDNVICALTELGKGQEPTPQVLTGCEDFICKLFNAKDVSYTEAKELRWNAFRTLNVNQGVEKLPPTQGAMVEHIRRAHLQCHVWQEVLVPKPCRLDPTKLGWYRESTSELKPILSKMPPAPESVTELVRCGCSKSLCNARCSCKQNNLECTELCKCEANPESCMNTQQDCMSDQETDSDE